MTIILSNLNRFKKLFSLEDSLVNLQLKGYKKSRRTLHMCDMLLHYLVTETAKQAINDNLQGSVAACLRCGGVDNNHIKKGLLLTLEWKKLRSVNIWQSYKQESDCLVHLRAWTTHCYKTEKVHRTITFLLVTLPNIHRFKKKLLADSAINLFNLVINNPPHLKYAATLPCNLSVTASLLALMFHKVV